MPPPPPAHRRQTSEVYRLRRVIALTFALLLTIAILQLAQAAGDVGSQPAAAPTTTESTTTTTIAPPPACLEGDLQVLEDPNANWATLLVDTQRAIPASYSPPDLHNIADAGFPLTDGVAVRELVLADLDALRQAAAANGTPIGVLAGYRGFSRQQDLFDRRTNTLGDVEAGSRVARPGHSEHQLGTTVDLATAGALDVDQAWGASLTGQWIATNAFKYGFIISYPPESQDRTCYDYEPWHLRYVGRQLAADIIDSGLTSREYLWQLQPRPLASTTTVAPPG